jgi:hypothetical protein
MAEDTPACRATLSIAAIRIAVLSDRADLDSAAFCLLRERFGADPGPVDYTLMLHANQPPRSLTSLLPAAHRRDDAPCFLFENNALVFADAFSMGRLHFDRNTLESWPSPHTRDSYSACISDIKLLITTAAILRGGLALHSSAAARGDRAICCFGRSGAGKTTIARLLAPRFATISEECTIVAPAADGGYMAHGTPFIAPRKLGLTHNRCARLESMFLLAHGERAHAIEPLPRPFQFFSTLSCTAAAPAVAGLSDALMDNVKRLCDAVDVRRLHFVKNISIQDFIAAHCLEEIHAYRD